MAAILLAKRATINVSKFRRFSGAFFSTAYERAEGSNAVAETEGVGDRGSSAPSGVSNDPVREGMYEAKQIDVDMTDPMKDGPIKAAEMADTVGDTAKQTLDGKWKAAREGAQKIKDAAAGKEDEAEGSKHHSSSDDRNIEDLRRSAGGYDKKEN